MARTFISGFVAALLIATANATFADAELAKRQGSPSTGVLRDFNVYPPVLIPEATNGKDAYGCVVTQTLMIHDFASSIGSPYSAPYTPPSCSFNRVTINLTVTARGRQYDRLGFMYLGDYEVWRTSTAEPTTDGIVWSYVKEMQQYNALWQKPQTLIFDLDNEVDSTYTGIYNTTLTATFFTVPESPPTADRILAISKRSGSQGQPSVFQIPSENASVAYTLPSTVERAVVSLSANGQIDDEFWYSNSFNEDVNTFNASSPLIGGGPWREVQLLIDGQLAGVAWPFPVIFTGGVVPGLWRPIVSIQAFDLREHEIDITPWLGHLLDGKPHTYEVRVASVGALDGHGGAAVVELPTSYWLVTGKIFLFLNKNGKASTASKPQISIDGPGLRVTRATTGNSTVNNTLVETTQARRNIAIHATVNGKPVSWTQNLRYSNRNYFAADATIQNTTQSIEGSDAASAVGYFSAYSYPLEVDQVYGYDASGNLISIVGEVTTGLQLSVLGPSIFPSGVQPFNRTTVAQGSGRPQIEAPQPLLLIPDSTPSQPISLPQSLPSFNGAVLNITQVGSAKYYVTTAGTSSKSFSFGTTNQTMTFAGASNGGQVIELYHRDVHAVNTSIVSDQEILLGVVSKRPIALPRPVGGSPNGAVAISHGTKAGKDLKRPNDEL